MSTKIRLPIENTKPGSGSSDKDDHLLFKPGQGLGRARTRASTLYMMAPQKLEMLGILHEFACQNAKSR
jgi:hypothetical protein